MAEHIVPVKIYVTVFVILLICTGLTAWIATVDLSVNIGGHELNFNPAVALLIAIFKATLVILFFMHIKYSKWVTRTVVIAGVFWLCILLSLTMTDYLSRAFLTSPVH
jgi:cytochrome c oxidase subunit IV